MIVIMKKGNIIINYLIIFRPYTNQNNNIIITYFTFCSSYVNIVDIFR